MNRQRVGIAARFALAAVAISGGAMLVATSAGAATVPETGAPGMLWLEAEPYPMTSLTLARGDLVQWPVTANLQAPTSGELTFEVSAADPLATDAAGLRLELAECAVAWVVPADPVADAQCADGSARTIVTELPFAEAADGREWALGPIAPDVPRHFLATLALPLSTPGELADERAEIGLGFRAGDVDTVPGGPAGLPTTGSPLAGPLLVGVGLLLAGSAAGALRRGRTEPGR